MADNDLTISAKIAVDGSKLDSDLKALPDKVKKAVASGGPPDIAGVKAAKPEVENFSSYLKGKLADIKGQAGKSSLLGQSLKLAQGAGAIVGITMLGKELENVTAKMGELRTELRAGQLDGAGMAVKIGESLPVIGAFVSAGQNIRELFTGEKAELDATNAAIELGNKLMEDRAASAATMKNASKGYYAGILGFENQIALMEAKNETDRKRVQVEIEYKSNSKQIDDKLKADIEARKKDLDKQVADIAASRPDLNGKAEGFASSVGHKMGIGNKKPVPVDDRAEKIQKAKDSYDADEKKLKKLAGVEQTVLEGMAGTARKKVEDITEQLNRIGDEAASKLATTDAEKIAVFNAELLRSGMLAANAEVVTKEFAKSLQADHLAEFKNKLQELNDKLATLGSDSRATAINEMGKQLSEAGISGQEAADKLAEFAKRYDEVAEKVKTASFGDKLKNQRDQVASFGLTPAERAANEADAAHATADQKKEAIELAVKVEGQEKAQQLADSLKQIRENAEDAGKTDLARQVSQLERLAKAAGNSKEQLAAVAEAAKKLQESKVADFIKGENDKAGEVGLSAADKAVADLKAQGITDPKLLADAWTAAAKLAGAELQESVKNPLEKFQDKQKELNDLKKSGSITPQTYARAMAENSRNLTASFQGTSIEDAFKKNIERSFIMAGLSQKNPADKAAEDHTKATNDNTKASRDLTKATNNLNNTVKGGVPAKAA